MREQKKEVLVISIGARRVIRHSNVMRLIESSATFLRQHHRMGEVGESVVVATAPARHAVKHRVQPGPVLAEADEDRPVPDQRSVADVPSEDPAELVLVRSGNVGRLRPRFELVALQLPATHHLLLLGDRQRLPLDDVVFPLLEEQHAAAFAGRPGLHDRRLRGVHQRRVLGAIDEPRQVEIAVVGPAHHLVRERCIRGQRGDDTSRHVEHDVVGRAGQPDHDIVLRRRKGEAVGTDDGLRESRKPGWRGFRRGWVTGKPDVNRNIPNAVKGEDLTINEVRIEDDTQVVIRVDAENRGQEIRVAGIAD